MTDLPPDVVRLLDAPSTAHLATLLPDGAPHSAPREDRAEFLVAVESAGAFFPR